MTARLRILAAAVLAMALFRNGAVAEFSLEDNGKSLVVLDEGRPVLVYNYGPVVPPPGIDAARWTRSCYIHPLYGLDGDIISQDFPADHLHHRGVFWAWPHTAVGDRTMDLWVHQDAEQRFESWGNRVIDAHHAQVEVHNVWVFKDKPDPVVRETVRFDILAPTDRTRPIDFELRFENISAQSVRFLGATAKGYGGFCYRPDSSRPDLRITTIQGYRAEDALALYTPWADFSSRIAPDKPFSGAALFQHPSNPGYPHPGWLLRYYGFLGASWPHLDSFTLQPGESFHLKYRLLIHRGTAEEAGVAKLFEDYEQASRGETPNRTE